MVVVMAMVKVMFLANKYCGALIGGGLKPESQNLFAKMGGVPLIAKMYFLIFVVGTPSLKIQSNMKKKSEKNPLWLVKKNLLWFESKLEDPIIKKCILLPRLMIYLPSQPNSSNPGLYFGIQPILKNSVKSFFFCKKLSI